MKQNRSHFELGGTLRPDTSWLILITSVCVILNGWGQSFDSGSDESDGALVVVEAGTYAFFQPGVFGRDLDTDGDGIYHFTTVEIGPGVVLDMTKTIRGPVTWLVSGDVHIDGVIDLNGEHGHPARSNVRSALPGAGGFAGGVGLSLANGTSGAIFPAESGEGPGGGKPFFSEDDRAFPYAREAYGGAAGHAVIGGVAATGGGGQPGDAYGNNFLLPLLGGSGGAGGGRAYNDSPIGFAGGGGGAGGGAILIASSSQILIGGEGKIQALGGDGGRAVTTNNTANGGGGSGGAIRLVAPVISGAGKLSAAGGAGSAFASLGRIRLESYSSNFTGSFDSLAKFSTPGPLFLDDSKLPLRVIRVGGVELTGSPRGGFVPPDLQIDETGPTTIEIEARGIPVGTMVEVTLISETEGSQSVESSPLAGSVALSTASAQIIFPSGFSRFFLRAKWDPRAEN